MKIYQNKKWNMSLEYPDDWKIVWENEPDGGWEIVVAFGGKPSKSGNPLVSLRVFPKAVINFLNSNITVYASGGPGAPTELARTPEEYNNQCKQELVQILNGLHFISEDTKKIAGMPAAILNYKYPSNTGTIHEKQINIFDNNFTYRFMSEAPEEQRDYIEKYFDSLIDNFKPFANIS